MAGLSVPYATLEALRARFNVAASDTGDDQRLLAKLHAASAQIDRYCSRSFSPVYATRQFDWNNARSLLFRGEDLLQLITLTNGDGNIIASGAIIPLGGINGPLYALEINIALGPYLNYITTKTRALTIYGIWGWHDDWTNTAWKASGDIVNATFPSAATTLSVTSVSGPDGWGLAPRFQTGQLLQIDSEYLLTTAVNAGANTVNVIRGVNGTASATHALGTPIYVYAPPVDITEITLRYAAWLTRLEDAGEFGLTGGLTAAASAGGVHVPMHIPPDLQIELEPFRKVSGAV